MPRHWVYQEVAISTGSFPFTEDTLLEGEDRIFRTFEPDVDDEELVWHRDKRDRIVYVVEGNKWHIQYENGLPIELITNHKYIINKEDYHRVIKGDGQLKILIEEV